VPLAYKGVMGISFLIENIPADYAVTYVRFTPMAAEFWSSGAANAYIVEQGRLFKERQIHFSPLQIAGNQKGLVSHLATVPQDNLK
jgi:hypothetical protein